MNLKYILPGFLFIFSLFFSFSTAQAAVLARPESLSFECSADGTKVKLKWKRVFLATDYQLRVDKITGDIPEWFRSDKGDQNPKSDGSECPAGSLTTAGTEACQTLNITPNTQYEWSIQSLPTDSPANSKEGGPEFRCVPKAKPLQIAPISWNVKLSPVCDDGTIAKRIQTRVDFGVWPLQSGASKGIDWQSDQTTSGTHQIQIISTDNLNNIYLKMFAFSDSWIPLELTKDLINPNIKYGTFFGGQNTLTWKRNDLAEGNYTFRFKAPDSFCQKTLPSAPTKTSTAITSTPAEPSPALTQQNPSPAQHSPSPVESSAPIAKKVVKIVVNNQDVTDKDFAKIKVTDSTVAKTIDLRVEITYSDGSIDGSIFRFNYTPPVVIIPTVKNLSVKCDPAGTSALITWDAHTEAKNGYLLRLDKNPPSWNYDRVNNDDVPTLAGRTDVNLNIEPNTKYLADVLILPSNLTSEQQAKYNPADNQHTKKEFECASSTNPTTPTSSPTTQTINSLAQSSPSTTSTSTSGKITCQSIERDGRNSGKILAPDTISEVSPNQAFNIVANIAGDDGRRDNIKWSATGGTFNGSWDVVDWVAPQQSGEYKVSMSINGVDQPNCTTKFKVTGTTLGISTQMSNSLLDSFKSLIRNLFN